ncbi:MAG: hypothetical protein ABIX28_19880 [Vicinamibacterales bacterium]
MRDVADWSMGLANVSALDARAIPGLNGFFSSGRGDADLDPGRVRTLLGSFKKGHWRRSIA